MYHSTAPLKLIVMIDSNTYCKYWYIVVCVTIPFVGPRALCQKLLYSTFDFWVGKLNKRLRLVLLLHLGPLSSLTVIFSVNISHSSYFGYWIGKTSLLTLHSNFTFYSGGGVAIATVSQSSVTSYVNFRPSELVFQSPERYSRWAIQIWLLLLIFVMFPNN